MKSVSIREAVAQARKMNRQALAMDAVGRDITAEFCRELRDANMRHARRVAGGAA